MAKQEQSNPLISTIEFYIMSKLNKVIATLLLLSVVKNIYNYQERDIFLGVPDNVCHYG